MNGTGVDTRATELVHQIDHALTHLADLLSDPDTLAFDLVHPAIEQLEKTLDHKATIDAAFAYAADLNKAGHKVGSSRAVDYLMRALDISRAEATARLRRGTALYAPPAPPPDDGDDDADADPAGADSEEDAAAEQARRDAETRRRIAQAENAERARKAQEAARQQKASAEKRAVIDAELRNLDPHATPGPAELLHQALAYATHHPLEDLRTWLREQIRTANQNVPGPKQHNIAFKRRYLSLRDPDEHGGVRLHGYLPADMAAVLSEALNPARHNLLDGTDLETTEGMSLGKKRVHLLMAMSRNFLNTKTPNLGGVGSIVVSMTLTELETMRPGDQFPTNTGHLLDPFALIRLGEAKNDSFVIHSQDGKPLYAGTGKRTASLHHRLALFASELVCSTPGCDQPMSQCEAHHIIPHAKGGETSLDWLTLLCWGHHRDNNDARDPLSPFGWAERDPATGRVGHRRNAGSSIRLNDSPAAGRSGAAKIRNQHRGRTIPADAGDNPGLFNLDT